MKKENIFYLGVILVTLIAGITFLYKINSCQVLFVVDDAVYKRVSVRKNTSLKELLTPEKDGYVFIGWYDENNNLLETNQIITNDISYYARWAKIVMDE